MRKLRRIFSLPSSPNFPQVSSSDFFLSCFFSTRASSNVDFPAYTDDNGDDGNGQHIDDISPSASAADMEVHFESSEGDRFEEDNYCRRNRSFVWCLPRDYNQEKHPFTCKNTQFIN